MLKFFQAVLGANGATVMEALSKASEELGNYLTPRIIVGWLRQTDYGDVEIPDGCPLSKLSKNGYGYFGVGSIEGVDYSFQNASEEHVTAVIAVASKQEIKPVEVKDVDLARLAKTIDLLLSANKLHKAIPKAPANQYERTQTASNLQPEEPIQPEAVQPARNKTKSNKIPQIPGLKKPKPLDIVQKPLKVTKSEATKSCDVCGQRMFLDDIFVGCTCFKPLAKNVKTSVVQNDLLLTFDSDWDQDSVLALIGSLKDGR
jgi:hypothetical protein